MDVSRMNVVERVARVLAGMDLSVNGEGSGRSVGQEVDDSWRRHLETARAVLHTLREPDERMAAVGDAEVWTRMVRAALGEDVVQKEQERRTWSGDIYQKPLG